MSNYLYNKKITQGEVNSHHVQSAEDILSGSPADNKAVFDALPELIVSRFNSALDAIGDKQDVNDASIADLNTKLKNVKVDTSANWNAQTTLLSEENVIYVYTDRYVENGENIPAFKVGDGLAYLIDLPFNDLLDNLHRADTDIHVTADEKDFWDNKVTVYVDVNYNEELVLSKE